MYICEQHGYDKMLPLASRYNETLMTGMSLRPQVVHYCGEKRWWEDFDEHYRGWYMEKYSKYFQAEACRKAGIQF